MVEIRPIRVLNFGSLNFIHLLGVECSRVDKRVAHVAYFAHNVNFPCTRQNFEFSH
jgi:hypothetical protein